jgi:hypothetical protein
MEITILKIKNNEFIPKNFTGIVELENKTKFWFKEGNLHRLDGPACEHSNGTKKWWIDNTKYDIDYLNFLSRNSIYIGKEKGQYNFEWLRFLTENRIEEFPIMPGMEFDVELKQIFDKLSLEI